MKEKNLFESGFIEETDILNLTSSNLLVSRFKNGHVELSDNAKIYLEVINKFELACYQSNPTILSDTIYVIGFDEIKICVISQRQVVEVVNYLSKNYNKKCRINKIQRFEKTVSVYMNTVLQN